MEVSGGAALLHAVSAAEVTCWQPHIARLKSDEVLHPTQEAAALEAQARHAYSAGFYGRRDGSLSRRRLVRFPAIFRPFDVETECGFLDTDQASRHQSRPATPSFRHALSAY